MIEVEKRTLLNEDQYNHLSNFLSQKGKHISIVKRFTLVKVENADFTSDPNNLTDIKIRTTKDKSLFTIKHGNWHDSSGRKENEINFDVKEIKELIEMLISLGFNYFVAMYVTREKFEINDLIVTIDKYHHMQETLVEVEKTVLDKKDELIAQKEILDFLDGLNLIPMDSKDTIEFIEKINRILETRVDFTKTDVSSWYKEWENFILCLI